MNTWITDVLEKKDEHRALLADLLVIFHNEGLVPGVALGEAFALHLEFLAVRFIPPHVRPPASSIASP